ncbi:MAG: chorismate-binding protein, partial [Crocinitomicaceae bacterium]
FQTVHQMISTVSCDLREDLSFADIIKATFPMGSMTGAPKISAMNLINKYEDFARGIYSGSIGYLKPNGDFDLNVIIRTLIYNSDNKYLSCPVGGAITTKSVPENEYNECIVKVGKILETLGNE